MRLPIRAATCLALIAAVCAPTTPAWSVAAAPEAGAGTTKATEKKPAEQATTKKKKKARPVDCAKVKCIALTFDDGPGKRVGTLLDTLKKHNAKATFFLEGQYVKARPELAKRIAKEGHQLGNHSYRHPDFTKIDEERIRSEIVETQRLVHKLTGKYPTTLRPPYGLYNDKVQQIATELGLPIILWNTSSHDWASRNQDAIYREVLQGARRDSVVLLHDWVDATVDVMPRLLTALKKRGFHVVTVDSLLRGRKLKPGEVWPADATISPEDTPLVQPND
jgi:peptidoglycan/xylan/chitin deacetylase (PgdA/CDA1 family)